MKRQNSLGAIFCVPLAIAAASVTGLVVALTGDGLRDGIAWAGLGLSAATVGWAIQFRRQ